MSETSPSEHAWSPILEGGDAARARDAIDHVATCLRRNVPPGGHAYGGSAAFGDAGFAILFAELARAGWDGASDRALGHLDAAIAWVGATVMSPSLFSGFLSVAWTQALLEGTLLEPSAEPVAGEIESVLVDHLRAAPWRREYDLISGLVGYGVYALARHPSPFAEEALQLIVDRLGECAAEADGCITWLTPPALLPEHEREHNPEGLYNVGVAHGVPGVIAFLGQTVAADAGGPRARELLEGALVWLDRQRLPASSASTFPAQVGTIPPSSSRLAWCYGDAGIAAALRLASASVPALQEASVALLRKAASRPRDSCGVRDAGLCHGSAGLAQIFNRFHHATGDPRFREAAAAWCADVLDRHDPSDPRGGFPSSRRDGMEPDAGLVTGSAGVALALLAAVEPHEPRWDQLLLLSPSVPRAP